VTKLKGTIRITSSQESEWAIRYYDVSFIPYHGRLKTQVMRFANAEELVEFLVRIKVGEDDSVRWAGKVKQEGLVLIPDIQLAEDELKGAGLIL
jgi:hypothetical protein